MFWCTVKRENVKKVCSFRFVRSFSFVIHFNTVIVNLQITKGNHVYLYVLEERKLKEKKKKKKEYL